MRSFSIRLSLESAARFRLALLSLLALAGALSLGCVHDEEPLPAASLLEDEGPSARAAGVRVRVDGDPGLAMPYAAASDVTPVRLVVENHADVPLRIRYRELRLVEDTGHQKVALPPLMLDGEPLFVRSSFGHTRFSLAPGYERFYEALPGWDGPWGSDPYYQPTHYSRWRAPLPTTEMLARALPEGVLAPGGRLDGLVYFESVSPLSERVTLVADLVNARTGAHMGTVRVPFQAQSTAAPYALKP